MVKGDGFFEWLIQCFVINNCYTFITLRWYILHGIYNMYVCLSYMYMPSIMCPKYFGAPEATPNVIIFPQLVSATDSIIHKIRVRSNCNIWMSCDIIPSYRTEYYYSVTTRVVSENSWMGLLPNIYVKLRVAHAPGMPGTFSPPPTSKETAS